MGQRRVEVMFAGQQGPLRFALTCAGGAPVAETWGEDNQAGSGSGSCDH